MKTLLLTGLACIGLSLAAFAQPNLNVHNDTECYFRLDVEAWDSGCNNACSQYYICIPPGTTVVPSCGPANYAWDQLRLTATDADCEYCKTFSADFVSSPFGYGCTSLPTSSTNVHPCGGCEYTVFFGSADDIIISP